MNNIGIAGMNYCKKTIVYNFAKIQNHSLLIIHRSLAGLYFFKAGLQGDHKQPYLSSFSRPTSLAGIGEAKSSAKSEGNEGEVAKKN